MSEVRQFIYQLKKVQLEVHSHSPGRIKINKEGLLEFWTNQRISIGPFGMYYVDIGLKIKLRKKILNPLNYCLFISNHVESEICRRGIYIPEFQVGLPNNQWINIILPFVNPVDKNLVLPFGGLICKVVLQNYLLPLIKN